MVYAMLKRWRTAWKAYMFQTLVWQLSNKAQAQEDLLLTEELKKQMEHNQQQWRNFCALSFRDRRIMVKRWQQWMRSKDYRSKLDAATCFGAAIRGAGGAEAFLQQWDAWEFESRLKQELDGYTDAVVADAPCHRSRY